MTTGTSPFVVTRYKDEVKEHIYQLKAKEDALHEEYSKDARKLLIKKGAQDLLPMLGLE